MPKRPPKIQKMAASKPNDVNEIAARIVEEATKGVPAPALPPKPIAPKARARP